MILTYSIVNDVYYRPNGEVYKTNGFRSLLYYSEHVYRKVENDWKKVYLCREQGKYKQAYFAWKVSLQHLKPTNAYVSIGNFTLFETGKATADVCGSDGSCTNLNNKIKLNEADLRGIEYFTVLVVLGGGSEYRAWQHSQLFRSSTEKSFLNSLATPEENLRIEVNFSN